MVSRCCSLTFAIFYPSVRVLLFINLMLFIISLLWVFPPTNNNICAADAIIARHKSTNSELYIHVTNDVGFNRTVADGK